MLLLMVLLYPIVSHAAILQGQPQMSVAYLLGLFGFFLFSALIDRKYRTALIPFLLLVAGSALLLVDQAIYAMYLPPVVISLGLFVIFGKTLLAGKVPLITRYAELIDGELTEDMTVYTYRVTQVWTVFFLLMFIESVALAIFAPTSVWSLFTNVINYVAIAFMFVAEYIYRKKTFSEVPNRSFIQFMQQVARIKPSELGV